MAARDADVRVRVAAVIPQAGDSLVLVRHVKDGRAYHLLPGGGVETGETLAEALVREVREETGLACRPVRPLFINDTIAPDGSRHVVQITFLAQAGDAGATSPVPDDRVAGSETVPVADLARLDLRPPMAARIAEVSAQGYDVPAAYLGALWADDTTGDTDTGRRSAADDAATRVKFT